MFRWDIKCHLWDFILLDFQYKLLFFYNKMSITPFTYSQTSLIFFKWALSLLIKSLNYKEAKWCNYYETVSLPDPPPPSVTIPKAAKWTT